MEINWSCFRDKKEKKRFQVVAHRFWRIADHVAVNPVYHSINFFYCKMVNLNPKKEDKYL